MGRPAHDPARAGTRILLLRAATTVFARDGFSRATLADIARGAGISRPSLLYHFATKELLYDEVVSAVFADLAAALAAEQGREAPWLERVEGLVRAFTRFLRAHEDHARLVVRELLEPEGRGAELVRDRVAPILDGVVAFVAAGPVAPGVDVRAALLQLVSDGLLAAAVGPLRPALWGPADADAAASRTWDLARRTFLGAPAGASPSPHPERP